ncbi:T9SS type A sorting domain-containing protein [Hymenobacter sp. BT186]|uniref:T9SS type A sorting domain-containing protein n=1 Tax=Hymenobacter telluris TaxID=2816474 RepID=A0A939EZD5_9BACT|nr:T9SS type A sorting domain-containing protein [Hymenobacter telluris]MBO0360644.1 T9SS type A sorting domain-containing protein [Hymenobacter telluris]MBW3376671.1 T9SS type A sorting domain-containing protein [Hymenobacter norwichensis]
MNRLLPTLLLTAAGLLGSSYHATAQAPTKLWDKTLGGSITDRSQAIQPTSDGGYIVGGYSNSPLSGDKSQGGRGDFDYWVLKLDASGSKQWDKTFGGINADNLRTVLQTADGGYLLGGTSSSPIGGDKTESPQSSDYWLVKLDASGTKVWDRTYGGSAVDELTTLQPTSDGGFLLGGYSNSPISGAKTQANLGSNDYWVVKIDATGTKLWDKTFGGSSADYLYSLQQTTDGGYVLGGYSSSPISGDKTQASWGNNDYWVLKLDASGTKQWDRTVGSFDSDVLYKVAQTTDGGYILGGHSNSGLFGDKTQNSQGGVDYWVVKLNASGTVLWDKTLGGWGSEFFADVQQTSDGGFLIGGVSDSNATGDKTRVSQGDGDCWLIKLSASGVTQWDKSLGGNRVDDLAMLRQTADGGYILACGTASDASSDKTQASQGGQDFWVIKLAADPLSTKTATARPALTAYPNPTRDQFTLRGPLGTPYQLLNQLGQVVRAGQLSAQPLDVQALPAGLYLLRDQTSGHTTKLIKE